MVRAGGAGSRQPGVLILPWPLAGRVTFGKRLYRSVPQFPHFYSSEEEVHRTALFNEAQTSPYMRVFPRALDSLAVTIITNYSVHTRRDGDPEVGKRDPSLSAWEKRMSHEGFL